MLIQHAPDRTGNVASLIKKGLEIAFVDPVTYLKKLFVVVFVVTTHRPRCPSWRHCTGEQIQLCRGACAGSYCLSEGFWSECTRSVDHTEQHHLEQMEQI